MDRSSSFFGRRMTTRRTLFLLLFIAGLALVSIVLISEQLISRHMGRQRQIQTLPMEREKDVFEIDLDIVEIERWAEKEVTAFPLREFKATTPQPAPAGGSGGSGDAPQQPSVIYRTPESGVEVIEDGIFFTDDIEARLPPGPTDQLVQDAMQQLRSLKVVEATRPSHQFCGRQRNRYIKFSDGNVGCARNRESHMEYVQGEVMAFYLARLLGMTNTPAVVLSQVSTCANIIGKNYSFAHEVYLEQRIIIRYFFRLVLH